MELPNVKDNSKRGVASLGSAVAAAAEYDGTFFGGTMVYWEVYGKHSGTVIF